MGWTGIPMGRGVKSKDIDRRAECDAVYNYDGVYKVLKSAIVGTTYYAAVECMAEYNPETKKREPVPEGQRRVWAAVCLTRVRQRDGYTEFLYKDMTETMGPFECDCPLYILDLLTPTDNEYAQEWRNNCRARRAAKKEKQKDPQSLNNLPVGSAIRFSCPFGCGPYHKGDAVTLRKVERYGHRPMWADGLYRWKRTQIPAEYEVLTAAA